jgi:transposase
MARTKPWTVSDEFWEKVEPLVPPAPSHAKGDRTRMDDRKAFAAIVYVLRTGIQWNALPRELGQVPPCTTVSRNLMRPAIWLIYAVIALSGNDCCPLRSALYQPGCGTVALSFG